MEMESISKLHTSNAFAIIQKPSRYENLSQQVKNLANGKEKYTYPCIDGYLILAVAVTVFAAVFLAASLLSGIGVYQALLAIGIQQDVSLILGVLGTTIPWLIGKIFEKTID